MGKITIVACTAVLAFTLGVTSPSWAQSSSQGAMGMMNGHHMARASKLSGQPIYNAQGQQIGTLNDVLIDPSGGPAMVVISAGSGGQMKALPVTDIKAQNGKMYTQLELEQMHEFNWNTFYGGGAG
jgi:sporulation protein YlmC with PRC-barrel domain